MRQVSAVIDRNRSVRTVVVSVAFAVMILGGPAARAAPDLPNDADSPAGFGNARVSPSAANALMARRRLLPPEPGLSESEGLFSWALEQRLLTEDVSKVPALVWGGLGEWVASREAANDLVPVLMGSSRPQDGKARAELLAGDLTWASMGRKMGGSGLNAISSAIAKSSGKSLPVQLTPPLPLAVVRGFVALLDKAGMPRSEWPEELGRLARQYVALGMRLRAAGGELSPTTSTASDGTEARPEATKPLDQIVGLATRAMSAREEGDFAVCDLWLTKAIKLAQAMAPQDPELTAALVAARASTALLQGDKNNSARFLEAAAQSATTAESYSPQALWWLIEAGDILRGRRSLDEASRLYDRAQELTKAQLALIDARPAVIPETRALTQNPAANWRALLALSLIRLGDVQFGRGFSGPALGSFEEAGVQLRSLARGDFEAAPNAVGKSLAEDQPSSIEHTPYLEGVARDAIFTDLQVPMKGRFGVRGQDLENALAYSHFAAGDLLEHQGKAGLAATRYGTALTVLTAFVGRPGYGWRGRVVLAQSILFAGHSWMTLIRQRGTPPDEPFVHAQITTALETIQRGIGLWQEAIKLAPQQKIFQSELATALTQERYFKKVLTDIEAAHRPE